MATLTLANRWISDHTTLSDKKQRQWFLLRQSGNLCFANHIYMNVATQGHLVQDSVLNIMSFKRKCFSCNFFYCVACMEDKKDTIFKGVFLSTNANSKLLASILGTKVLLLQTPVLHCSSFRINRPNT